jgi:hypothetical protein
MAVEFHFLLAVAEAMTNKSIIFLKGVKHNNGIADM